MLVKFRGRFGRMSESDLRSQFLLAVAESETEGGD
jgi:hypothetical protein